MVISNSQAKITDLLKKAYGDYFGIKFEDQDKPLAHLVCWKTFEENQWLEEW